MRRRPAARSWCVRAEHSAPGPRRAAFLCTRAPRCCRTRCRLCPTTVGRWPATRWCQIWRRWCGALSTTWCGPRCSTAQSRTTPLWRLRSSSCTRRAGAQGVGGMGGWGRRGPAQMCTHLALSPRRAPSLCPGCLAFRHRPALRAPQAIHGREHYLDKLKLEVGVGAARARRCTLPWTSAAACRVACLLLRAAALGSDPPPAPAASRAQAELHGAVMDLQQVVVKEYRVDVSGCPDCIAGWTG